MKQRLLFAISFLIILLIATTVFAQQKEPMATVRLINGSLQIKRSDTEKWEIGTLGMMLFSGDQIKTGENSKAYILFTDATQVKMNASSLLTIEGKREEKSLVKKLQLKVGEIWAKVTRQDSPMQVETPTSVASVKGTEFDVLVDEDGNTWVFVFEGSIDFMNELGSLVVGAMQQSYAEEGAPPEEIEGEIPEWQDEIEPQWNILIEPEIESVKAIDEEFGLYLKATDINTGEIDEQYDKTITVTSNSPTMQFSADDGQTWLPELELTLGDGEATILAKNSDAGNFLIGAAAEETSPGFTSVVISEEGAGEIKTMDIQVIDEDGNAKTLRVKYSTEGE